MFLVRSGPAVREQTLNEIRALGADTLRIEVKWSEVAPSPGAKSKPSFTATDPSAYPGFEPYDDLVQRAVAKGFRIMITLAPDAPNWATAGGRGGNYKVDSNDFADFARAVGRRYSGAFGGLPAVKYFSIWNEPNHIFFLKPRSQSPRVYRRLVERGMPGAARHGSAGIADLRGRARPGRHGHQGDRAQALHPGLAVPGQALQAPARQRRPQGRLQRASRRCRRTASPTTPTGRPARSRRSRDIINISVIRRLATALDKAARAGGITARPAASTTRSSASRPTRRTRSSRPRPRARRSC